jgi:hypothetical protein
MPTRRSALLFMSRMAVIPLVAPLWALPASAQDKGGGGGNGKGNDGKGGGNGKGNGNGNGGGNGKGGGGGKGGASGASSGGTGNAEPSATSLGEMSAVVRHRNGLEESIVRGRYIMKDNKGRTIVNRRASRADNERLKALRR